ncbi:hypothetical protein OAU00_03400 [Saprospiraceae bacterium]|nr:hypothetical protein [Saprospiraceae bacterium]
MDYKFKEGDEVCTKEKPSQKLIISRRFDYLFYCTLKDFPDQKEFVFFERELLLTSELDEDLRL